MNENKNKSPKRTAVLVIIAATSVIAFALVMGAGLTALGKVDGTPHAVAQSNVQTLNTQAVAGFDGLDVQVTVTSNEVKDVLKPEEILPIAQETAKRIFGRDFVEFVMLDCFEDESVYDGYVWRVYAYFGQNGAIDMLFDASTGKDISCLDGMERQITPDDVEKMNLQAGADWNAYSPIAPPEYTADRPINSEVIETGTEQNDAELEFYQTLKQETLDYITANKGDMEIEKACTFATDTGLLGDAEIEDAWLLVREETDSPYGYAEFSVYEIKLTDGGWLVIGGRSDTGFFSYNRPQHSQVELYDIEIQRLGGENS